MWRVDETPEEVVDAIMNIDEAFVKSVLLKELGEEPKDSNEELIRRYFHHFAKSSAYDDVLTKNPTTLLSSESQEELTFSSDKASCTSVTLRLYNSEERSSDIIHG